jgi:hypothetical protein
MDTAKTIAAHIEKNNAAVKSTEHAKQSASLSLRTVFSEVDFDPE